MDAENRSNQQKNFDQWLDSALHARVNAEPRMGLEERVMARMASEAERARVGLWPLFAFAAALLVVVIGIPLFRPSNTGHDSPIRRNQRASQSEANSQPSVHAMTAPNQKAIASVPVRHARVGEIRCCHDLLGKSTVSHSESLPKRAAFPTARPATEQERLLLHLAAQPDFQMADLNADLPLRELPIPALNIPPMEGTPPDKSTLY